MMEIVFSNNNYYIKEENCFYGSFNSIAEAMVNIKDKNKYKLDKKLIEYKLVIKYVWG